MASSGEDTRLPRASGKRYIKKVMFLFLSILVAVIGYLLTKEIGLYGSACMDIRIWAEKHTYLPYEPLLIKYEIRNVSDGNLVTHFDLFKECFDIKDEDGKEYRNTLLIDVIINDTLAAGASIFDSEYIQIRYWTVNPGEYTCRMKVPEAIVYPNCSRAVQSNGIEFSIVEPKGDEWEAYQLYLAADSMGREYYLPKEVRQRNKFEALLSLAETYPRSTYAPIALYGALLMKLVPDDSTILISVGKRLAEDYPESPYSARAFMHVIDIYKGIGKMDEAVEYLNYLKDTYPRSVIVDRAEYWLKKIEEGYE